MKVFVECYHDAALAHFLGVPLRQLGHESGKVPVLRQLAKFDGNAVGMIDADTGKLHSSSPSEMANYREQENRFGLKRLQHCGSARKSVVVIDPALEEWLYARANECQLRPGKYRLPPSASAMHKSPRWDGKPGFTDFLRDLAAADEGMKLLGKWLCG